MMLASRLQNLIKSKRNNTRNISFSKATLIFQGLKLSSNLHLQIRSHQKTNGSDKRQHFFRLKYFLCSPSELEKKNISEKLI